jgi:hypothetical protein
VSAQSEQERNWVGVRQRQCLDASSEKIWRDTGFVRTWERPQLCGTSQMETSMKRKIRFSCALLAECSMKWLTVPESSLFWEAVNQAQPHTKHTCSEYNENMRLELR